jgi:peptidoglycan/xylan/chitin deacetylase (PgdA/CDA1 family)
VKSLGTFPEPTRVALTFDAEHPDRPGCPPGNADVILDTLRDEGIRATFFVQGRWAEAAPVTAKRIADEGHLIGNHSHYHARMTLLHDDGIAADVGMGQDVIHRITGADPRPWFRCPFGDGADDPRVLAGLATLGYRNIHWDIELDDWEPERTAAAITGDAVAGVRARAHDVVVLLHTWPASTARAIGPMIAGLRGSGATFVTVDQLHGED